MKKNVKILYLAILFLGLGFYATSFKFARADTCSGTCRSGSSCSGYGEVESGGDCATGNICCKISSGSAQTTTFPNPLGISSVSQFLDNFLASMRGIVAVLAIIFIVLGGIFYMLSAGNEKMITRAKLCWTGAVIGLAIVLAAPSFLLEITKILGPTSGVNVDKLSGAPTLYTIGVNILNLLLSVFGIIAIISLVSGGGMYLTAYGDEKRIDAAKKIITYSIIGIVVALAAVVIINQISSLITGS